jgi:CelD/BcsL family acetyltransferase involved in cellulose biosynthesis
MNACVKVDLVDSPEMLLDSWRDLYARCEQANPFQSPEWLLPWTRHLFGGGDIWMVAMREAGELIGLAPLFRWGAGKKTVSFLGAGVSDYGGLLCASEDERACAQELCGFLESRRSEWDSLDLREIPERSSLLDCFPHEPCSVCPILDLDSYPECMDRKHRTDLHRARNKLAKIGASFRLASEHCLAADMTEFLRLYELRHGQLDPRRRSFYCEIAREFVRASALRLSIVTVGGVTAASILAFVSGPALYFYLSAYDPSFAKLSPGAALIAWTIEQAIAEGCRSADFLRDPEPYKYLWGARDRRNYRIYAG